MKSHPEFRCPPVCRYWKKDIDSSPDGEGHEAVHCEVGMPHREVCEMPYFLQRPEGLERTLSRADEITHYTNKNEHERIRMDHAAEMSAHGQQEICAPTPYR